MCYIKLLESIVYHYLGVIIINNKYLYLTNLKFVIYTNFENFNSKHLNSIFDVIL